MNNKIFKILSLDGGGYKGLSTISCLADFENRFKCQCSDIFDMFAGTSTGSIIALALASGKSAAEIKDKYISLGKKVFNKPRILNLLKPKYSNKALRDELNELFIDTTIGDIYKRGKYIVIPALNLTRGQPRIFKTDYKDNLNAHNLYKLADIALASSSAPVYLPASKINIPSEGESAYEYFVDGGMFANNPSVCALIEANKFVKSDLKNVRLLSIATPTFNLEIDESSKDPGEKGLLGWGAKLIEMALQGTSIKDHFLAEIWLRFDDDQINRYIRLKPEVNCNIPNALDKTDEKTTSALINAGVEIAQKYCNDVLIKEIFNKKD